MKRTGDRDQRYGALVQEFDDECAKVVSQFGTIDAQKVNGLGRFCRAPFRREPSQLDLPSLDPLPKSISSDLLEFPLRSLSFGQQLYLGDIGRGFADPSIWQTRPYNDTPLAAFETATLTPSIAAMTTLQSGQRTLSVSRYAESPSSWISHPLPVRTAVDSMAVDSHFAYLLTADRVFLVPLTRDGRPESAAIPATASGRVVAAFMEGAVAGFHASPKLLYVTAALAVRPIATPYRGVTAIAPIEDRLLCGVIGSGAPRLLAPDGREARAFVGHTAPVLRLARLSDQTFASTANDATVRVWDVRERFPVLSVGTNGVTAVTIAGSSEYLVAALQNKVVNVFDLRNAAGRAVLGVSTQDYAPVSLHYNQHEDMLAMFGGVENGTGRDALIFGDRESQTRQRIFRVYRGFVGVDPR
jgi:WD40 repeat protein